MARLLPLIVVLLFASILIGMVVGAPTNVCQVLKSKQLNYEQVVNSLEESEMMIKALRELSTKQNSMFSSQSVSEQIDTHMRTSKELSEVKKSLEMHVAALNLLCPTTTSTNSTPSVEKLNVKTMSTQSIPNIVDLKVSIPVVTNNNDPKVIGDSTPETYEKLENAIIIGNGLPSCLDYLNIKKDAPNGLYWIKPEEGKPKYIVYCDQKTNGGGWILVTTRVRTCSPKVAPIVKPLFNGDSMSKDKWGYLRSSTKELMWAGKDGRFATADMEVLKKTGICKPLSMDVTDPLLYHKEDLDCDKSGEDYCLLGVSAGRTSEIFTLCRGSPFKKYGFKARFDEPYETNVFVR